MFRILKRSFLILTGCIFACAVNAQITVPAYYMQEKKFNDLLERIIKQAGLDSTYDVGEDGIEQVHLQ